MTTTQTATPVSNTTLDAAITTARNAYNGIVKAEQNNTKAAGQLLHGLLELHRAGFVLSNNQTLVEFARLDKSLHRQQAGEGYRSLAVALLPEWVGDNKDDRKLLDALRQRLTKRILPAFHTLAMLEPDATRMTKQGWLVVDGAALFGEDAKREDYQLGQDVTLDQLAKPFRAEYKPASPKLGTTSRGQGEGSKAPASKHAPSFADEHGENVASMMKTVCAYAIEDGKFVLEGDEGAEVLALVAKLARAAGIQLSMNKPLTVKRAA